MDCKEVQGHLSDFDEPGMTRLTVIQDHLESCADCRAESSRFQELREALGSLSEQTLDPPSWLEGTITETVAQKAARLAALRRVERQVRRPQVLTGGALVAAGIAGALLFRSRRKRRTTWRVTLRQALAPAS